MGRNGPGVVSSLLILNLKWKPQVASAPRDILITITRNMFNNIVHIYGYDILLCSENCIIRCTFGDGMHSCVANSHLRKKSAHFFPVETYSHILNQEKLPITAAWGEKFAQYCFT